MKSSLCSLICLFLLCGCHTGHPVAITDDIPSLHLPSLQIDYSAVDRLDPTAIPWGLGKAVDSNLQPVDAVEANRKYQAYNAVYVGQPDQKIYLTFDNGYENGNTEKILDTLKEKKVSAVFFVTGQYVKENPGLIERMIDEGHIIGNHSLHHYSFPSISTKSMTTEIMGLHDLLMKDYLYKMTLVRPPKGEFSERCLALASLLDYQSVFWSYAYYDYNVKDQPDPDQALKKLLDHAHPGAIYLLHSVSDTNTEILADLIDGLRNLNYEISSYDLDKK